MRTTLAIDDDVLVAAKGIATAQQRSLGEVLSSLARQGLGSNTPSKSTRNGVPLLARKSALPNVTLQLVNQLRDELP